jgi:crotonobetainyl-CoA:carnitine CoA-transferase CaiB-like acyl-CoA transferase
MKVGVALADVLAGKDAAIAVLGALIARFGTGRGRRITISLAASARAALVNVAQNSLVTGREAERWGNAHPNLVPYQLFMAKDRALILAVGNDAQWQACVRELGLDALADDSSLSTNAGRVANRERVTAQIADRLASAPAEEWCRRLSDARVPAGMVRGVLEALREAGDSSPLTGVAPSLPGRVHLPPPALDEHGEAVRRLGWEAFAI